MRNDKQFITCKEYPAYDNEGRMEFHKPIFILADRFATYRHTAKRDHDFSETTFTYVIRGQKEEERVFINLFFESRYEAVTKASFHYHAKWDREISLLLFLAFIKRMKDKEFVFTKNAIPTFRLR